jgi:hypothetical protein
MVKMTDIILLASDKLSLNQLVLNVDKNKLNINTDIVNWSPTSYFNEESDTLSPRHLYVISDDAINIDNYIYDIDSHEIKVAGKYDVLQNATGYKPFRKIIGSTDKTLNIPEPYVTFIVEYINMFNDNSINDSTHFVVDYDEVDDDYIMNHEFDPEIEDNWFKLRTVDGKFNINF